MDNPFGYRSWRSIATGSLLGPPPSVRMEAFTKRVSLVPSVPYPAWMCPETGTLGTTNCGVADYGGRTPEGSSADEEAARKILTSKTPLGVPWIEPEDVAPVVVFLTSDAARMVSGATYDVTGGDSAHNTA